MQLLRQRLFLLILCCLPFSAAAQWGKTGLFRELLLKIDTATFSTSKHIIDLQGTPHLYFRYEDENPVCEVEFSLNNPLNISEVTLKHSEDFQVIDSLLPVNDNHYRFKVRFRQLTFSNFVQFTFSVSAYRGGSTIQEIKLFPVTTTTAFINPTDNQLFIGEERTFRVETNKADNIKYSNQWTKDKNINYRFSNEQGELRIHLLPDKSGLQTLEVPLSVRKPSVTTAGEVNYQLPPLKFNFQVKESKLVFLKTNKKEITLNKSALGEGTEIELDYFPYVEVKKTYRIENQEESGGDLIAEIFTRSVLANGKFLCWLRTYNYHRQSEGYLYIKDGDIARFITNFSITPAMKLTGINVIPVKGNESQGQTVFPGEQIELKLTGEGLDKASFSFEGLTDVRIDSLIRGENEMLVKGRVPASIAKPEITVLNLGKPTGQTLRIKEYQSAHPLNFIHVKIEGEPDRVLSDIDKTIFIDHTLDDIVLAFNHNLIDGDRKFFGKQYLIIDVQITNNNNLVDKKTLARVVVCPGENSIRFDQYDRKDCQQGTININQLLRRKTHELDDWSTIEITIQHDPAIYGSNGYTKKVEFVLRKYATFDMDVSFPAGLVTKKAGEQGFGSLSGISMAIIAQFSFYHPDRIAKLRPYKIGAGFLAFNAFNFSQSSTGRDVGIVVLGSLYPLQKAGRKLSFPLYVGGGYFMAENKFFYLLGPGIRVQL